MTATGASALRSAVVRALTEAMSRAGRPEFLVIAAVLSLAGRPGCAADVALAVVISEGRGFAQQDGEGLYRAVCQSCHMAEGQGAQGAGNYPALAGNPRLAAAAYPIVTILHGRRSMPAFGWLLSDDQVARVTDYVRTHMGNRYTDAVTPETVKSLRRPP